MFYTISSEIVCEVEIQTGIDGDVWDINGPHLVDMCLNEQGGILTISARSQEKKVRIAVSEGIHIENAGSIPEKIVHEVSGRAIMRKIGPLQLRTPLTIYKFISHCIEPDHRDPLLESREICLQAMNAGYDRLLESHAALWNQRWQTCDIRIEGDNEAQQALRFSMYHLLSIAPTHSDRVSIPARGLSGQVYKGAIFWDTEIFMLPFFSHTFPGIARNLLRYRFHTLDGARRKAREYGYRGAFYAWESQDTGDDACTLFNITDVFTNRPMRTYFRDKQIHISADIVYALWQYFLLTDDRTIWLDGGAEIVFECARFYLSYLYYNLDKDRYEILEVTGPDEYHERVHNNAFTNRMVAHTYNICLRIVELMGDNYPLELDHLVSRLDFQRDLDLVKQVQQKLYLPDSVEAGSIIPQFDGYLSLEEVTLSDLFQRKLHPNEYLGGGNGLATTTQILKQADVILELFLFDQFFPIETKHSNWEFYEPRTEHGSSLSACSYSIVAAQIGKVDWAYRYLMKTATIDLLGKGKQYVGTLYIGGTHPAGNGGAWMSVVFGLCGIHCSGDTITITPNMPDHWTQISVPLVVRGQEIRIDLAKNEIKIQPITSLTRELWVNWRRNQYPVPKSGVLVLN